MPKSDKDQKLGRANILSTDGFKTAGLSSKNTIKLKGFGDYKIAVQPASAARLIPSLKKVNHEPDSLVSQLHPGMNLKPFLSLKGETISERELERVCFNQTDLSNCNLQKSQLRGARFKGCNLTGADLRHANLKDTIFENCNLNGADLRYTKMDDARIIDCDLFAVNFDSGCLDNAVIDSCNMGAQSFHNASCLGVKMSNSQIAHGFFNDADLSGCELRNMQFKNCTLSHTDFHDSLMDECEFKGCDSFEVGPVFSGGNLNNVLMEDCDFQVAQWVQTQMTNSHLARVDMNAALMEGTHFSKVLFEQGEMKDCYSLDQGPSFNQCRLDHVKINQADWTHARFDSSSFIGAMIVDSDFSSWSLNHTGIDNETSVD